MHKGSQIPEELTVAGILDRTLWVLRFRFLDYLKICFVTFIIPFPLFILLYYQGFDSFDFMQDVEFLGINFQMLAYIFGFINLITIPSLLSDIAMQFYTSHLVRDKEIKWHQAIKMAFSQELAWYSMFRAMAVIFLTLISLVALIFSFIPFIGSIVYLAVVVGAYTFFFGISPASIVEDKKKFFDVLGRNFSLGKEQFMGTLLCGIAAAFVCLGVVVSLLLFFYLLGGLIIAMVEGQRTILVMDNFTEQFFLNLTMAVGPLIFVLFFVPIKSIYFSVLYYNLRSRKEGFHLENRLNIHIREFNQKRKEEKERAVQEAAKISATA